MVDILLLVAGAGIAPTSKGYEPFEILLLYPAMYLAIITAEKNKSILS